MRLPCPLVAPLLALALLAACTAQQAAPAAAPSPPEAGAPPVPAGRPPPPRHRLPPEPAGSVAADCEMKNVGNCCGYFPACVSKDAKVDPDAVRAECERTGMSSVCGFQDIQACACEQGQCRAVSGPLEVDR